MWKRLVSKKYILKATMGCYFEGLSWGITRLRSDVNNPEEEAGKDVKFIHFL